VPVENAERSRVPIEIGTAGGVNAVARTLGQVCVSDFDVDRSVEINGFRVCSVERALLDACRILPRAKTRNIVGEAFRRGMTTELAVLKTLRQGRRGGRFLRTVVKSYSQVDSDVFGRKFLQLVHEAGIARPQAEFVIDANYADAAFIRLDFYWAEQNLAVELDGFAYHSTAADVRRDRERQNAIVQHGITLYRYTWSDVTEFRQRTIRQLRAAFSS